MCVETEREIDISENPNFYLVDGVLMNKGMTQIIYYNFSKFDDYSIPRTVTSIGTEAFSMCVNLTSITNPVLSKKSETKQFTIAML